MKDVNDLTMVTGVSCNPSDSKCHPNPEQRYNIVNWAILNGFHEGKCQKGNDLAVLEVNRDIEVSF